MDPKHPTDTRRIVVIGPCASGKTSLTARLRAMGYDAHTSGQEHSEIAELWRRLGPDVVVGLRIKLATLRERRSETWSAAIYGRQLARLASGYRHADLVIDSDAIDGDTVADTVVAWLRENPEPPLIGRCTA